MEEFCSKTTFSLNCTSITTRQLLGLGDDETKIAHRWVAPFSGSLQCAQFLRMPESMLLCDSHNSPHLMNGRKLGPVLALLRTMRGECHQHKDDSTSYMCPARGCDVPERVRHAVNLGQSEALAHTLLNLGVLDVGKGRLAVSGDLPQHLVMHSDVIKDDVRQSTQFYSRSVAFTAMTHHAKRPDVALFGEDLLVHGLHGHPLERQLGHARQLEVVLARLQCTRLLGVRLNTDSKTRKLQ